MTSREAVAELPIIFGGEGPRDKRVAEAADSNASRRQGGDDGSARKLHETFSLDMLCRFVVV
jgi:hypothetical protein